MRCRNYRGVEHTIGSGTPNLTFFMSTTGNPSESAVATVKNSAKCRNKRPQLRCRISPQTHAIWRNQSRAVDLVLTLAGANATPANWLALGDALVSAARRRFAGGDLTEYNKEVDKLLRRVMNL